MKKFVQLALIFLFYFFGVQVKEWLGLPIPGSIIGLLLLLVFIIVFKNMSVNAHAEGASVLIRNFTLFFIPTTVAIILYLDLFRTWNAISFVAVLASTLLTIVLTAWVIERSVGKGEA
ncbi:holin-like protein [Bhargavaea ginsengi]|uniref:Holin-like protein n=1 Tax=Bhargavaea ginsengi TaxID=426757 RepID=A0A1H6TGM7_9BACL|nr:CidA/LrgA family protein [Bhargavaea ginsengi]MCM3087021.1 CidA/LrgA family protein [Bhargavaea ginsengi]SEI79188.1 holin-like protein [Bhargavaea ginsengi]